MRLSQDEVWAWCNMLRAYISEDPGIWSARLCRLVNGIPETRKGVMHCGLCEDYANPRKRNRDPTRHGQLLLPGVQTGGEYQLRPRCKRLGFAQLRGLLRRGADLELFSRWEKQVIPDDLNHRGWDFATRFYVED
jgi:hypothetical protein